MEEIEVVQLKRLIEVVKYKFGFDFHGYATSSFKRRVVRILEIKKMADIDFLVQQIENDIFLKDDFLHEITVNVTELFRDPPFWQLLRPTIEELLKSRDKIRIWHQGCSSGEEVYSILIVLKEMNLLNRVEIMASDMDKYILAKAKIGKISIRNMPLYEKNYLAFNPNGNIKDYFLYDQDYVYFDKKLLSKVTFSEFVLGKDTTPIQADLILCRNVMIYFNQSLQNEVVKLFFESLTEGGYLALGTKESIMWTEFSPNFVPINFEDKIYKKK